MSLQEAKNNEFLAPLLQDMRRGPHAVKPARRGGQHESASTSMPQAADQQAGPSRSPRRLENSLTALRKFNRSTNESQSSGQIRRGRINHR
jgi:hypothetical protein